MTINGWIIAFVKAREKLKSAATTTSSGLLAMAQDWELKVDLEQQLKFPKTCGTTTLRKGMLLILESFKKFIIPCEDHTEKANKRERAKYTELKEECQSNGLRMRYEPIEVRCRRFAGQYLCRANN